MSGGGRTNSILSSTRRSRMSTPKVRSPDQALGVRIQEDDADDETKAEAEKKPSLLDNLKSMKSQVHMPAFLSKKTTPKEKDPEAGK